MKLLNLIATLLLVCLYSACSDDKIAASPGNLDEDSSAASQPQGVGQGNGLKRYQAAGFGFVLEYNQELTLEIKSETEIRISNKDARPPTEELSFLDLSIFKDGHVDGGVVNDFDELKRFAKNSYPDLNFEDIVLDGALGLSSEKDNGKGQFEGIYFVLTRAQDVLKFVVSSPAESPWKDPMKSIIESFAFDEEGPEILSLRHLPEKSGASRFAFEVKARDELSQIDDAFIYVHSNAPGERHRQDRHELIGNIYSWAPLEKSVQGETLTLVLKAASYQQDGLCHVPYFNIRDKLGNSRLYVDSAQVGNKTLRTGTYWESVSSDSSNSYFYKKTNVPLLEFECESEGPQDFTSIPIVRIDQPGVAKAGEKINLTFHTKLDDDDSESKIYGDFRSRRDGQSFLQIPLGFEKSEAPNQHVYSINFPEHHPSAEYVLDYLWIRSRGENEIMYRMVNEGDEFYQMYDRSTEKTHPSTLPVQRISLVNNGFSDVDAPRLAELKISSKRLKRGEKFEVTAKCSDSSGCHDPTGWARFGGAGKGYRDRNHDNGFQCPGWIVGDQVRYECEVPLYVSVFRFCLKGFSVQDTLHNRRDYWLNPEDGLYYTTTRGSMRTPPMPEDEATELKEICIDIDNSL